MAKIQLIAVVSLDGCLSDFTKESSFWINPHDFGIMEFYNKSTRLLTSNDVLYQLEKEHKEDNGEIYLALADSDDKKNVKFVNSLMKRGLIDELILYTLPIIAGTGIYLFKEQKFSHWKWVGQVIYNDGIFSNSYTRLRAKDIAEESRRTRTKIEKVDGKMTIVE